MYLSGPKLSRPAMRQRSFVISAVVVAALIFSAVGAYAYDSAHDQQIAHGVKAGGVNIGGLSTRAARRKLDASLTPKLVRTLTVVYQGQRFDLDPGRARLRVNVHAMVNDALDKSRGGNIISRTLRGIFGGTVHAHVPASVSYDHGAVDAFVKQVAGGVNRAPRDATIAVSAGHLNKVDSQDGRVVREDDLRGNIQSALTKTRQNRDVAVPTNVTRPRVTSSQLASRYPSVITIYRAGFTLRLYKNLNVVHTYTIAVGRQGLETPAGEYTVQDKEINPSWHVPNSSWAGSLAGQVIPPGPQDPLKARWIGITDGSGIHGTEDIGSLGSAASHGCIRMSIPDVIELYNQTPYGSKIFVE
jgi:lipoprotein-anchoring transpeptidase ErfK/SrfK